MMMLNAISATIMGISEDLVKRQFVIKCNGVGHRACVYRTFEKSPMIEYASRDWIGKKERYISKEEM